MVKIITSSSDILVSLDTQHYIPGTMRRQWGRKMEVSGKAMGRVWGRSMGDSGKGGREWGYWKERER